MRHGHGPRRQGALADRARTETFAAIFLRWLPAFALGAAHAPEFERYSADFDPMAGPGQVQVRVPLKA